MSSFRIVDTKFRILKGGKIGLAASIALFGGIMTLGSVNANADVIISTPVITNTDFTTGHNENLIITSAGSIIVNGATTALDVITHNLDGYAILNQGTITLTGGSNASAVFVDTAITGGTITNEGTISNTVTTNSGAAGINLTQAITGATIENTDSGTITVISTGGAGAFAWGMNFDGAVTANSTINNAATIDVDSTGDAFGIRLSNTNSLENSDILNSGTINVTSGDTTKMGYGISVAVAGDNATITNSNQINVNGLKNVYGIYIQDISGNNTTITNSGDITVEGKYARGIKLQDDNDDTTGTQITNSGTIDMVDITSEGVGIYAYLSLRYGTRESIITNSGTIQGVNDTSSNGVSLVGIKTNNMFYDSSIINSGINSTINLATNGNSTGILALNLENSSSVINQGEIIISSTQGEGKGIELSSMQDTSNITNSGTISVTSFYAANGILVTHELTDTSSILNSGTIEVTSQNGTAGGIIIDDGIYSDDVTISNSGTISVDALEKYSVGIMLNSGYYTPTITNSGTITATMRGEADGAGYSLITNGSAVVNNTYTDSDNYGKLYGNVFVGGTLNNDGLVSLPHNATAEVTDFVNGATGVLEIGVLTDGTTTTHSQLQTDDATFENGSTIRVNVLAASTDVAMIVGGTLHDVVEADNSLTIEGTLNIADTSNLIDFEYVTNEEWTNGEAGSISLNVITQVNEDGEEATIDTVTRDGGGNTNTQQAGRALQTISSSIASHPAMASVISQINTISLQGDEAVARAVESTTPVAATAAVGTTTQISNGIAGIVQQRQNITMSGQNSGDGMFSEKNFWIKPFGSFGSQNDKDGINGFDLKAYGVGFGFDGEYKPDNTLGVGFFYTNANVDVNHIAQESDLDVYTALVYGNVPVIDSKTKFLYQAGYSLQKTSSKRDVFTGDQATAKYTGKTAYANAKLLRDYRVSDKVLLQPLVEATYRHFTNPAYTESGAGALNLEVDKFTSEEFILGTGVIGYYVINDTTKFIGNLSVGYDMIDDENTVTSAYQGASGVKFDTTGIDNGRWSYEAGLGIEKDLDKNSNINFSYNYNGKGSDFSNNTVSMKYVLKF